MKIKNIQKLTLMFNCHINVEVVSSIESVKYLYKYIYKGHDAAAIIVTSDPLKYIGEFLVNFYLKKSQCFSLACSFT